MQVPFVLFAILLLLLLSTQTFSLISIWKSRVQLVKEIDRQKDAWLFGFIDKYWPRRILPNHLTIARIVIGLFLFVLLFDFRHSNGLLILPIFALGALTDLFDGALARHFHQETNFGKTIH